ncbi:MAG: divalent-cation tolerance protein CutA [Bacteroidota bacterium]
MTNIPNKSFIAVYITHPTESAAKKIVNFLLDKQVIACGNIFPIQSAYTWKNAIQEDKEWVSLVKTTKEAWPHLCEAVESVHPYEVPCITRFEVSANAAYANWVKTSVKVPLA